MIIKLKTRSFLAGTIGIISSTVLIAILLSSKIDFYSALLPFLSLFSILTGSIMLLRKDKNGPGNEEIAYPYIAFFILITLFIFGKAIEILGLATSVFLFLILWWAALFYRACSIEELRKKILSLLLLAAAIGGVLYVLFILLLDFYISDPLLF